MDNGTFIYTRPGSDEEIGRAPAARGHFKLAEICLSRGRLTATDPELRANLAGLLAAQQAGVPGVEVGDPRELDDLKVAELMCRVEVGSVPPEGEGGEEAEEVPEEERNPTGTSAGN